ncbi:glutamine--tRNA ligase/YqeY domain fusion protein [Paenibacillus agricola]|uniref:Glutamine--tRNA ligase n=1 Tax=Paenibacillus agricola TaxID=2716264 RepID=A0ABX0JGE0_9BACL|nr:glutamine--tRNA ligase/YqeY domain fusion protein [Paenibacillus agricola]NHN34450.1 glutamine--tRNA ligase/YqeY domain fusion protein [Paenibacillus agricola]
MDHKTEHQNENFLIKLISDELEIGAFARDMCTRFPPEPNGYLHIGSAYAIHTNYEITQRFNGTFHLRFDDTNPLKEDIEYVHAIIEDIKWLGYDPGNHIYYGSDYSADIYNAAVTLIKQGKAYVCDLAPEQITEYRGTLTEPGRNSPFRNRSVEENLELFATMKNGGFPAFSKVVRAKIDMGSPNINLRDPVIYRIIHAEHYRTGTDWCIYPLYDFAHPIQDAIEGVTYSLCSIEFKDHRPLYDWVLKELGIPEPPRQREFGRLSLTGVVTSKRFLRQLVEGGYVDGWDDPRLPTIRGLRRRGFTPASIRRFTQEIGSIRTQSTVDISLLEHGLRQDLKEKTISLMAVLQPLKIVITNYPEDEVELLMIENNSDNEALGKREVPFSKTIYIERDDFLELPTKGFHRLSLNAEVRLKGAYFIKCEQVLKDPATGEITELHCTYDKLTKSGTGFTGRKVKGTIHWVSAKHAVTADVHLYEKLLLEEGLSKDESTNWADRVNPHSLVTLKDVMLEPFVEQACSDLDKAKNEAKQFQFFRHGYFCVDSKLATVDRLVFNRIVPLKDTWNTK